MTLLPSCLLRLFLLVAPLCLPCLGGAAEVFSSDFSKGTFEELGWEAKGDWKVVDYGASNPGLAKNPGPVARFAAHGTVPGTLTKTFDAVANPSRLALTFDAGYGWGGAGHAQVVRVMILDADGNGYLVSSHRANATWAVQWAPVRKNGYPDTLTWAPAAVDTTQASVHDGGGLRTFTLVRDASGNWTFNGAGWTGGPLAFTDATTTSFSRVVLCGQPNTDEIVYGQVRLEADK